MHYKRSIQLCYTAYAVLIPLRAALKILVVDTENGFYLGAPALTAVFRAAIAGFCFLIAFTCLREPDPGIDSTRGNRWLELSAALLGFTLLAGGASTLLASRGLSFHYTAVNAMPKWVVLADGVLSCLSGLVFLYLSFHLFSGAARGAQRGMLALVPVIWHTVTRIHRYSQFHQVLTSSDQLLETMFLILTTLFLLAHTRTMAGINANRKLCVLWALTGSAVGFALSVGQFAGRFVLGADISGPGSVRTAVIFAFSLYEIVYAATLARTPAKEPDKF